jgi:hypothetical protein
MIVKGMLIGYKAVRFPGNGGVLTTAIIDGCEIEVKGSIGAPGTMVETKVFPGFKGRLTAEGGVGDDYATAQATPRLITPKAATQATPLANG